MSAPLSLLEFFRWLVSGNPRRWLPLRQILHVFTMIAIAAAIAVLVANFLGVRVPSGSDVQDKPFEGIKIVLAIVGGLGGIVALTVGYRRQFVSEVAEKRLDAAEARENTRLLNERFGAASQQLGAASAAEQLAGVYAMAGLADDWKAGRQKCIDVLCGIMRMSYKPNDSERPLAEDVREFHRTRSDEWHVRNAIAQVVTEHLWPGQDSWMGFRFNFEGAYIVDAHFDNIFVSKRTILDFTRATFAGKVSFIGALAESGGLLIFDEADFRGDVHLDRAKLFHGSKTTFNRSVFRRGTVRFRNAVIMGAKFEVHDPEFIEGYLDLRGVKDKPESADSARDFPPPKERDNETHQPGILFDEDFERAEFEYRPADRTD